MENSKMEFDLIDDLCKECLEYLESVQTGTSVDETCYYNFNEFKGKQDDKVKDEIKLDIQVSSTKFRNVEEFIKLEIEKCETDMEMVDSYSDESDEEEGIKIDFYKPKCDFTIENNSAEKESNFTDELEAETGGDYEEIHSDRLRKLSKQLPKIVITNTDGRNLYKIDGDKIDENSPEKWIKMPTPKASPRKPQSKRRITKDGNENVALISNIPFEKMRLLNDTFHTLINLRWRWIVLGTVLVHFGIWLVFAVFWYIAALAHYDFDPNPPPRRCVTGGKDFLNIFLASVEAQTTIGFGDRTIDEECPESIFLFIMQLIMGTGLSGVLTCVVYAKITRPENFSKEGVGFSKNAVISLRDGQLCLIFRVWDLNYDHIIGSEINAYFIKTSKTKEGEVLKHFAVDLPLLQRQLMLWPITAVHVIDESSPLYDMTPEDFIRSHYEITVSLKGASASMGTYTQSQTSYVPREVLWGYRFTSVVKYSNHEHKYIIDYANLNSITVVDTPLCSGRRLSGVLSLESNSSSSNIPSNFEDKVEMLDKERPTSFSWRSESSV